MQFISILKLKNMPCSIRAIMTYIIIVICYGCSDDVVDSEEFEKVNLKSTEHKTEFVNFFEIVEQQSLVFPDTLIHSVISADRIVSAGGYNIISETNSSRFFIFDELGKYVTSIGREGRGPGEFNFIFKIMYNDDILYIYDQVLRRFTLYSVPDFEMLETLFIDTNISDFLILDNKKMIAFTGLGEKGMVSLLDLKNGGKIIHQVHRPNNKKLSIYLAGRREGTLTQIDNERFLLLYPDEDYLFKYKVEDDRLIKLKRFTFGEQNNSFRPLVKPFDLDPYGYSDRHRAWDRSDRLYSVDFLEPDIIAIYGYCYECKSPNEEASFFMNLYTLDGDVIAEGIIIDTKLFGIPRSTFKNKLLFGTPNPNPDTHGNKLDYYLAKIGFPG